ncbi:hypothetical protein AYO21_06927 [Fonsecaea monophora]|uniref:Acyclic terpene utilisation N-terminal domain-containing protein n=1 Tax=Fonsecaea monophora TaxID=254056 RepID=A0A177F506_9EURO|nr:hypothetical protein AYO21_06927 [Fonsecaea monophora]OAG38896.1 hypothetical protein AYO21_06927 [Fonsecaea monophora]
MCLNQWQTLLREALLGAGVKILSTKTPITITTATTVAVSKMISKLIIRRIGSVSSTTGDNPHAMARMVQHGNVDVIIGDWFSEMKIAWNAIAKQQSHDLGYERGISFKMQLKMCLEKRCVFN